MSNNLGDFLKELRGKESLRSVADRSNGELSHSYISDLEKGVSRRGNIISPSPDTLKALAKVYNTDYGYLMELAGYADKKDDRQTSTKAETIAAHIDDDATEEEMEDILNYIEFIKQKHRKG